MIVATRNCGCPTQSYNCGCPRQSLLNAGLTESRLPCSPCCINPFCPIVPGEKTPSAIFSPLEYFHKKYAGSKSSLISKELDSQQSLPDKIISEIVRKGQPYKEIEATINDNRVIIRTHKEPVKDEYDPPCECIGQDVTVNESVSTLKKCDNGVSFEMAKGSLELCCFPREDMSLAGKSSYEKEAGCRTMTLYPEADEGEKPRVEHPIDLEENPNIFVLRIRKWCNNGDKQKIDFEFRIPRPWRSPKNEIHTVK